MDSLIAGAKKEDELVFIAGASTFGGRKGLADLEAAFNKRFGTKMKISFAAGPDMNARAARHITEIKSGRKVSSDIFLGSQSHQALMHKENALEKVNYSGIFSWVSKEMEIFPGETVLTYTSPNGIVYNKDLIPKDKVPKNYARSGRSEVEPDLGRQDRYPALRRLVGRAFAGLGHGEGQRLRAQAGGDQRRPLALQRRRAGRQRRISDHGELRRRVERHVDHGSPRGRRWSPCPECHADQYRLLSIERAEKCAPSEPRPNSSSPSWRPEKPKTILQKYESRSSHLVEGTMMQKYLKDNKIAVQEPKLSISYYLKDETAEGLQFKEELAKILKGS